MPYKNKEEQKGAQKQWIAKKRAEAKKKASQDAPGSTKSVEPDTNIPPVEPVLSNPKPVEPVEPVEPEAKLCPVCSQPLVMGLTFETLPEDVQAAIDAMSTTEGDRQVRIARAIHYQEHVKADNLSNSEHRVPTGLPANFGQADCQCQHCQNVRAHGSHIKLNHGPHKFIDELAPNELNRVSLPGDADYDGIAQQQSVNNE